MSDETPPPQPKPLEPSAWAIWSEAWDRANLTALARAASRWGCVAAVHR